MKKSLQKVLNLGHMNTTPANPKGVHFIAKVVEFGERKEVFVCCPTETSKIYKIPLTSILYGQLKRESVSGDVFLLIERKGPVCAEILKLKDYANSPVWKTAGNYEPQIEESVLIELQPTTSVVTTMA